MAMIVQQEDNQQPKCRMEGIGMIFFFSAKLSSDFPTPEPARQGFGNQPSNRENHLDTVAALRRISATGPVAALGVG